MLRFFAYCAEHPRGFKQAKLAGRASFRIRITRRADPEGRTVAANQARKGNNLQAVASTTANDLVQARETGLC